MTISDIVLGISTAAQPEIALTGNGRDLVLTRSGGALESVASMLEQVLNTAGKTIADIGLIGVCIGPGSFTGLRIGVAFARTLAQTLNLPIAGISSYDVAAYGRTTYPLIAVARGKKDYYYARAMRDQRSDPRFIQGSRAVIQQVAEELSTQANPVTIVGPDFQAMQPGEAARAVAQLARQARQRGEELRWNGIAIDYGQRPNAVVNWEKRRG